MRGPSQAEAPQEPALQIAVMMAVGSERGERILRLIARDDYPPDQMTMIGLMAAALLLAFTSSQVAKPTHDDFVRLASTVFAALSAEDEAKTEEQSEDGPPRVAFTGADFVQLAEIVRMYEKACEVQPEDEVLLEKVREAARFFRPEPAA